MKDLNLDCWAVVFDQLEPETRTLFKCLFVSKAFFHHSTRVLYRRPLETFEGQQEFSPFSTYRLTELLDSCSGFSTSTKTIPEEIDEKQQQQQQRQLIQRPSKSLKTKTKNNTSSINYYNLVIEYPKSINAHESSTDWKGRLMYFAETVPFLYLDYQSLDFVLPLVSRFKILHTLHFFPRTPNSGMKFGPEYTYKMVQFVGTHSRLYPGVLKSLNNGVSWLDSNELIVVTSSMGGLKYQEISINATDLDGLIVSRLTDLNLSHYGTMDSELVTKTMRFLKRCQRLERLEIRMSKEVKLDWNLLLENDGMNLVGRNTAGGITTTKTGNAHSPSSLPSSTCLVRLKYLVVWGIVPTLIQAMKIFSKTLESIKVLWNQGPDHSTEFLDWQCSFIMPRLKSIDIEKYRFRIENLSHCPILETLILSSTRYNNFVLTSFSNPVPILPITLRKLELTNQAGIRFNLLLLKPLRKLEYLRLECQDWEEYKELRLINMSVDWYFPFLKSAILSEKFALQIQGQILWIAPKLEYLTLNFYLTGFQCPMDTDTFLYPPWELNMTRIQQIWSARMESMCVTATIPLVVLPTTGTSVSFPALKFLSLKSFHILKFKSAEEFANTFFGRQADGGGRSGCLFPNLEQLCLYWDQHSNYAHFSSVALSAMRNLPKLEKVRYFKCFYDVPLGLLKEFLEPVPQNKFDTRGPNFRHRPLSVLESNHGTGKQNENRFRCVIEFHENTTIRFQLKKDPTQVNQTNSVVSKLRKKIFSGR